ncbi:MAG TPA: DUF5683 domain-containing protein [Candidatus Cloacimonadota bacterium]|nr:DUF5683 domain-containing protein [Candidatus Cloacimonadota bacterium]HPT73092.1 DUF5683 domain-containing protein [Candidatus Cloacimonadota bacterium]
MRNIILILLFVLLTFSLAAFDTGRSSLKAGLLSAALPGAGQYYNHSYVKSAIFFASEATFVGMAVYHTNRINYYYDKAQNNPELFNYYQSKYQKNYNSRQSDYWWIGTTVFLSVLDAYVDADLYNFDQKKKEIHLKLEDEKVSLELKF